MTSTPYEQMKQFEGQLETEMATKKEKQNVIGQFIQYDAQLMDLGKAAQLYMGGLADIVSRAEALLDFVAQYRNDPKIKEIAKQQLAMVDKYFKTFVDPTQAFVEGLYKIGILDPAVKAGKLFHRVSAVRAKIREYDP